MEPLQRTTDGGKVEAVKTFIHSDGKVLVCTHTTFRFAGDKFGVKMLDDRLIAVDEFHHVSSNPDNKLGIISTHSWLATKPTSSP
ncbi:MAG: hypothetical protein Fur0025_42470 [Oscillatoriaceae cyanobacterium]